MIDETPHKLIPQIERVEVCYAPGTGSNADAAPDRRRKPEPGMLLDAARLRKRDELKF